MDPNDMWSDEGLDEEDFELVAEHANRLGPRKRTKTRRGQIIESDDEEKDQLETLFDNERQETEHSDMEDFLEEEPRFSRVGANRVMDETWRELVDIFGDDEEYDSQLKFTQGFEQVKVGELFEPGVIRKKLIGQVDEQIRLADIPERIQIDSLGLEKGCSDKDMEREGHWMIFKLGRKPEDGLLESITKVLYLMKQEYYEVPFIAVHRKIVFAQHLSLEELWRIYDLDRIWMLLERQRQRYIGLMEKLGQIGGELWNEHSRQVQEYCLLLLQQETLEEQDMDDIHEYLKHCYRFQLEELTRGKDAKYKRPVKKKLKTNSHLVKRFYGQFGMSCRQYGLNLMERFKRHEPEVSTCTPEELAEEFVSNTFSNKQAIETAATLLAQEFSCDPNVRKGASKIFWQEATVSTSPANLGRDAGLCAEDSAIAYLGNKPLEAFTNGEYIRIAEAVRKGVISVQINLSMDGEAYRTMENLFMSERYSIHSEKWNQSRRMVLKELVQILFRLFDQRFQARLWSKAIEQIADQCARSLLGKLVCGPFGTEDPIMGISWGKGGLETGTIAVVVDREGQVVDHLKMFNVADKTWNGAEFADFVAKHSPCAVGLGGFSVSTRILEQIVKRTVNVPVVYVDDDIARIYMDSRRGEKEFGGQGSLFRYTVSIARRLVDPLMEISGLVNIDDDISRLRLCPWPQYQTCKEVARTIERMFVNMVNLVGVDVNRCLQYEFFLPTLQFVCGLGPRKAMHLVNWVGNGEGYLVSRNDLMGRVFEIRVFTNSASFLKISAKYLPRRHLIDFDYLDSTRIHPERYELARKMVSDALEVREDLDLGHFEELREVPQALNELGLGQYTTSKVSESMLREIVSELQYPYKDKRTYQEPGVDRVFEMLTGETDDTLFVGKKVSATVIRMEDKTVKCRIEPSGLHGNLYVGNTIDGYAGRPARFAPDQQLECRVVKIHKDRFLVDLARSDESLDGEIRYDPYHDFGREKRDRVKQEPGPAAVPRSRRIAHPLFRNVDRRTCEQEMVDSDSDVMIRPSTKGSDHLVLSWRMYPEIVCHVDIREKDKDNAQALGRILMIGDDRYEDLDEIVALFVGQMASHVQEVLGHSKFQRQLTYFDHHRVLGILGEVRRRGQRTIPYFLTISREYPGKFVLSYLPGPNMVNEFVTVVPNGLRFRRQVFDNLDNLLAWFKKDHASRTRRPRYHR